jgi:hypothetical protein
MLSIRAIDDNGLAFDLARFILDKSPSRTALVVIDVQRAFALPMRGKPGVLKNPIC